jgi:hypothetical protein
MNGSANRTERTFHMVMGGLMLTSLFLDQWAERMAAWDPPRVSMITLALAAVWIFRTGQVRLKERDDRRRVLEDRLERAENKIAQMERELAERQRPLI